MVSCIWKDDRPFSEVMEFLAKGEEVLLSAKQSMVDDEGGLGGGVWTLIRHISKLGVRGWVWLWLCGVDGGGWGNIGPVGGDSPPH